ncbi:hypothetical protein [Agrobacterium sp. 22-226-1]
MQHTGLPKSVAKTVPHGRAENSSEDQGRSLIAALLGDLPCLAYDEHLPFVREFIQGLRRDAAVPAL